MPLYLLLEVIKGNSVSPPQAAFPKAGGTWEWLGEGRVDRSQDVLQSLSFHSCINYWFLGFFLRSMFIILATMMQWCLSAFAESSKTATILFLSASVKYFPAHCIWQVCELHKKELHEWLLNDSLSHSGLDLTPCNRPQRGTSWFCFAKKGQGRSQLPHRLMLPHWLKRLYISAWGYPEI